MVTPATSYKKRYPHLFDTDSSLAKKVATLPRGDCAYTVFVGAGASVSSGVRPTADLIEMWRRTLYETTIGSSPSGSVEDSHYHTWLETDYPKWLEDRQRGRSRESEYAALFSRFHKERRSRQIFIENESKASFPAFGYLYLAGLVASQRINRILTTNYDDLINDALVKLYDLKPIVCAFDSAIGSIRFDSLRPKILKMHGDYLYDNIKSIGDEVVRLDANMEEKFLQTCKEGGLIVVGYQGSDESIMGPLQMMVRSNEHLKMGLHWCIFQPETSAEPVIPERLCHLLDNYSDRITIYPIRSFDDLMFKIFSQCQCEHPAIFTEPSRKNLFKEFQRAVKAHYQSFDIPLAMNTHLELYIEQSDVRDFDPEFKLDQADVKHRKGLALLHDRDLSAAYQLFEASGNAAKSVIEWSGTVPSALRYRALCRLSGALLGLVECEQELGMNWRIRFTENSMAIVEAERLLESEDLTYILPVDKQRLGYYNGICGFALKARLEKLSSTEAETAREYFAKLLRLDPEKVDQRTLPTETGFDKLMPYLSAKVEPRATGGARDKRLTKRSRKTEKSGPN